MEAELEVQRTIKRAELTAFHCLPSQESDWRFIKVHVDNKRNYRCFMERRMKMH